MKRIAVIVKNTTFNKSFGGLEVHTKSLVDSLSLIYEIDIFSPKRELKNSEIKEDNKHYHFIDSSYRTGLLSDLKQENWNTGLYNYFKVKNEVRDYDLIISVSSAGYPILRRKNEFKSKFLTISHGTALSEYISLYNEGGLSFALLKNTPYFIYNYLYKQKNFIDLSDYVICVSDYVRKNIITETGSRIKSKFKTIYNGAKIDDNFDKIFDRTGDLKIIFSGRVEVSKGIFIILNSLKNLNARLFVAGDGSALESAKKFTSENKLNEKVTFLGKLNYETLKKYYEEADVLVVPSLRVEGFPMSIIEGMSYFLPVIATKIGGNSDAVLESKTGFLIEPNNSDALFEKLEYFNKYPEKIKEFGVNARNLVIQRFSNEGMIKEYREVISNLMDLKK